jgi:hypothetical protein
MRAAAVLAGGGLLLVPVDTGGWALAAPALEDWALALPVTGGWSLARPGANRSRAWAKALSKALMSSDWGGKLARTRSQY